MAKKPTEETETPKTKLQTPKKFQVPSSKPRHALRDWNLELGVSLVFGAWSLVFGTWSLELQLPVLTESRNMMLLCVFFSLFSISSMASTGGTPVKARRSMTTRLHSSG